jgi:hypothetical protein
MKPATGRIAVSVGALLTAGGFRLAAQEHQHSGHGEQLGRVEFAVSCNQEAQRRFTRAIALLHSFWWEESERAFRAVAEADSSCGMAYWGLAMTYLGNPFAGRPDNLTAGEAAARRAAEVGARTSRERDYIAAVGALYRDNQTLTHPQRLRAYGDSMEQVARRNPRDTEAQIFYALSLVATASPTDTTYARQRRAAEILNPQFRRQPQHPGLAHYIIHAMDSPALAELGLDAARRYARIAPSVPHAQHMPSHIFIRLGLWEDNIQANRRSYDAGVAYLRAQGKSGVGSHEFHAADYMVYGYLQQGNDSAALALIRHMEAVREVEPPNLFTELYSRAAMPARYALERGRWDEAAALEVRPSPAFPAAEMVTRFARGVGAARSANLAGAREEIAALEGIERTLTERRDAYWARVTGIKRRLVESWVRFAEGDTAGALSLARQAADDEDLTNKHPVTPGEVVPARELEADMLMAVGRHAEARRAYEAVLRIERNRRRANEGLARASEPAGGR